MDMDTLLYLKRMASKDLAYSAGDSAQSSGAACMGGESGGDWMLYMYA